MMSVVNSYWESTKNKQKVYPVLQGNYEIDVTVIGAGFSGLSTAYFLAKQGFKVILVEQNSVGWGASGRNAGMLTTGFKNSIMSLAKKHGMNQAQELLEMSRDCIKLVDQVAKDEGIDCSIDYKGGLKLAYKEKHFESLKHENEYMSKNFNYETEVISASDLKKEIDSPLYNHGALLDMNSFSFHPLNYAIGLSAAAEKYGTSIYENSKVLSISKKHNKFTVRTHGGSITSENLVMATNGYSTYDTHKGLTRSLMAIDSHIITTEPLDTQTFNSILPNNRVASDTKNFLYYFRKTADQRLLFGGRVSFGKQKDSQNDLNLYEILRKNMVGVFPELSSATIDYKWAGTTAFTMDFMPHVGKTNEGVYYLTGYCGHGAAMSTLLGKVISDTISNESILDNSLSKLKLETIPFHSQKNLMLNLAENYMKFKDIIS